MTLFFELSISDLATVIRCASREEESPNCPKRPERIFLFGAKTCALWCCVFKKDFRLKKIARKANKKTQNKMNPVLRSVCAVVVLSAVVLGATSEDYQSQGLRAIVRVYDECSKAEAGFTPCLKKRAITFIDRLSRVDALTVGDMKIVRNERSLGLEGSKPMTEAELEQSLPRGLEARDEALTNILLEKIAGVFSSRTIQISLPKLSSDELGRGLEEGVYRWFEGFCEM